MSLSCLFGMHRPSLSSIAKRPFGLIGLCESCGRPLHKEQGAKWIAAEPLDTPVKG